MVSAGNHNLVPGIVIIRVQGEFRLVNYENYTGNGKTCEIRIRLDLRIVSVRLREQPNSVIGGKFHCKN